MVAVVIGASGGIGAALFAALEDRLGIGAVIGVSRNGAQGLGSDPFPGVDLEREESIAAFAKSLERALDGRALSLVINACGALEVSRPSRSGDGTTVHGPEKRLKDLDLGYFDALFRINAIGPALLIKHLTPLLPRRDRAVMVHLSARVGSISDNALGGWYAYRASKAALNQIVRTASIELKRTHPQLVLAALHPGTVDTGLSGGFQKTGLDVQTPDEAATRLLSVIDGLQPDQTGGFLDHMGRTIPW